MKKSLFVVLSWMIVSTIFPSLVYSQWLQDPSEEPKEDHAQDYMKWFYGMRTFGLGYIPQDAWMNAIKKKEELRQKYFGGSGLNSIQSSLATQANVNWINVGPINIEQGVISHAGRVNTIAVDPANPYIAYIGGANGGVWKTVNGGVSWKPMSDNAYSLAMGALAIDPSNPNVIYAGTGEYSKGVGAFFGAGILKSTDAGATWNSSGLPNVGAFSTLIVNPYKTSTVYAAGAGSGGGLYISEDAGASWKKSNGGLPPGDVTDISYARSGNNDFLYVGVPSHGVYVSQDGGSNWTNILQFPEMRRIHVDVDPKNPEDIVALSVNYNGGFEGLQQSIDGGADWNDISSNIDQGSGLFGSNNQGWYDAYVRRDPNNSTSILVGGISVWKTDDAGGSWTDAGKAYQVDGVHPDQHAAAFSNVGSDAELLYSGSDGGIAVSTDAGNSFNIYQDSLAITESYGIAIDQTVDDVTYTGNQDNGTLVGGRTGEWSEIGGGDGGTVVVDSRDNTLVYFIRPTAWAVTLNDGSDFSSGINQSDSVFWVKPLVQDETNHILYTGSQFLYVLQNGSSTWTRRSKKLATLSYISAIAPAGDGKTVLVGTTGGKVWSTTDNGVSFTDRSANLPGREVASIKVSPTDTKTYYVTLSGFGSSHVYKTTDLGATWKDISSTLPDISCNAIAIDDQHPTNLYIGTDVGVFFSPDDGTDWMPFGSGLPNVAVTDIAYHKTNRVIRAGTHGRSMWEAPMAITASGITTPTVTNIWYIGESAEIGWYGIASPVKIEISTDHASSWKTIADAATGNTYSIADVRYGLSENALIRVTSGSNILQSQSFRIRQRAAGTTLTTFSEQQMYMYDLAYDRDDNVLWVTNFTTPPTAMDPNIYKIDPTTGALTGHITVSGAGYFTGIKYDPSTKHLFVHQCLQDNIRSNIYEITTTGSIINKWSSPCAYGTGIFVSGDSLFLADRNNNIIHVVSKQNPAIPYTDLNLERQAAFGPRCITLNPATGHLLHTWTDFQGTETNAQLYDSYILNLNRDDGTELGSWFVQDGTNAGTNVRGLELDPRTSGTSVWVTVLNSGNSAKILKLTLTDGPTNGVSQVSIGSASFKANYPNPFSQSTTIPYSLNKDGSVIFIVRDVLGREVFSTVSQYQSLGDHQTTMQLQSLPSGRYFCELYLDNIRTDILPLIKE